MHADFVDWGEMQRQLACDDYHLHGEKLRMERVHPSTAIQVVVSSISGSAIHEDVIDGYFSNPRRTGVSSKGKIAVEAHEQRQDVFIVTYPSEHGELKLFRCLLHLHRCVICTTITADESCMDLKCGLCRMSQKQLWIEPCI